MKALRILWAWVVILVLAATFCWLGTLAIENAVSGMAKASVIVVVFLGYVAALGFVSARTAWLDNVGFK